MQKQKAILLGNGFSSQLIPEYTDRELLKKMSCDPKVQPIRKKYCNLFSSFSSCVDKSDIINKLEKVGFLEPANAYSIYFEKYNLNGFLKKETGEGVETLLKIGQLFSEIQRTEQVEIDIIRDFSCTYYWNNGANGLIGIKNPQFNAAKFIAYINAYQYIFTTNYDTILDDAYAGTVIHLHGSFLMDRDGTMRDSKENRPDSLIIWGQDDIEKKRQIEETRESHCWNSRKVQWNKGNKFNTQSLIPGYLNKLATGNFSTLDIVGYSGENDKHISEELVKNSTLEQINFYCNPSKEHDQDFRQKVSEMFDNKFFVKLISWNDFWNCFMKEEPNHAQPTT